MAKNRIFFPQEALNTWLVDGHVELTDEQLLIKAENRRYRITEAAHVVREVTGTPDNSDLVGRVKSKGYLAELGAELMESSMLLGDNAYDVVPGFLGTPIGSLAEHLKSNPVMDGKEVKLQTEEDLLGAFLLRVLLVDAVRALGDGSVLRGVSRVRRVDGALVHRAFTS